MERQAEQETTCPRNLDFVELRSNNMDLRPSSVHHVPDSEHDRRDPHLVDVDRWSYRSRVTSRNYSAFSSERLTEK
jgi:hypothetical protein